MKKYIFGSLIGLTAFTIIGGSIALATGFGGWGGAMLDDKADLLGITTEELQIQLEDSTLPEIFDANGITHQQLFELREDRHLEHQASMLGMTTEELQAELIDKTFAQLLDEQGISHAELREQMQAEKLENSREYLQQLVDSGDITEDEMAEKLEHIQSGHWRGMHKGEGFGHHGMFRDSSGT